MGVIKKIILILLAVVGTQQLFGQCPTITALSAPTEVIAGSNFSVAALGLENMAMADNGDNTDFGIEFVYFTGGTPPADSYFGGTSLGTVSNANLSGFTNPGQFATLNTASIPTADTYQVCAILDDTPADANCRPSVCQTIIVNECAITINSVNVLDCVNDEYSLEVEVMYTNAPTGDINITPEGETAQSFTPMSDADNDGIICDEPVCLDAQAILGGAYFVVGDLSTPADPINGWMRDDLRTLPDFPLTEPYTDLGFAHAAGGGGEMTNAGVLAVTGADAIVDWVFLELRSTPTEVVATRSALLQRDGDIVDVDGASSVTFDAPPGDYYVTIRQRNHLSVTTANAITFPTGSCADVDFTSGTTDVYNITTPEDYDGEEREDLGGGAFGLWPGNADMDDDVQANADFMTNPLHDALAIEQRVLNDPGNIFNNTSFVVSAYAKEDLNMNGSVAFTAAGNDVDIVTNTVVSFPLNTTSDLNYRVLEQYQDPTSINTISACSSGTETFTLTGLTGDGTTDIDVTAAFADQTTCTVTSTDAYDAPDCFTCPTIMALTAPDGACVGGDFDLEATDLADMAMADNGEADFGIEFVYFAGMTPPADPYTGGMSLGTVDNGSLTGISPNQSALLENVSIVTGNTYQVCAILNPSPADANCRPAVCETIRIVEPPVLTADPTAIDLCVNVINDGTMDVQFDLEAMPNITLETGEQLRYRIRNVGTGTSIEDPNNPSANVSAMPAADANGLTTILNPGDDQRVTITDDVTIASPENLLEPVTITYAIFPRHRFADGTFCDGEEIEVTVTIKPEPILTATPTMQEICANDVVRTDGTDLSTTDVQFTLEAMPNITLADGEQLRYRIRNLGLGMMPSMIDNPNGGITVSGMPVADPDGFTVILEPGDDQEVLVEDDIEITGDLSNFTEPITIQYAIFPRHRFADGTFCDGDDIIVTATIAPPVLVEAGTPQTICSTKKLMLADLNASIMQGGEPLGGTWSIQEEDSDGMFLNAQMQPLAAGADFEQAVYFMPGDADADRGIVTLVLTSDASDPCEPVSDEVEITVLKVDCGNFPWTGGNE